MSLGSKIVRPIIQGARAFLWKRNKRGFLLVFNWHQITPVFNAKNQHEYTWTPLDVFEREVKWLMGEYAVLPLSEAIDRLQHGCLTGACASLTFDDGDVSMSEHILSFLSRLHLPATFFINSAYLNNQRSYWFPIANYFRTNAAAADKSGFSQNFNEAALKLRRTGDPVYYNEWRTRIEAFAPLVPDLAGRLVSVDWLSGLDGEQFSIGAHGHEHERFSMMPADWQRNDLRENVRILSQFKGFKPIFAVPFGREWDWTDDTISIARNAGLDIVLADGGVNVSPGIFYRRIPGDAKKLRSLIRNDMARQ
jgi:peptidoglycan/xylan/chitin deacetylase (PgdA/CDA1 family)